MKDETFVKYRNHFNQFFASLTEEELLELQSLGVTGFQADLIADDLERMIAYKRQGSKSMNQEFHKIITGYYREHPRKD